MRKVFSLSQKFLLAMILASGFAGLVGCANDEESVYTERPVDVLYNLAMDYLSKENYKEAIKAFEEVDRQHPYSVWAARAQLMGAYSYYLANRYEEAIISLDRFIELHPGHESVDYAYYLKAISYYDRIVDVGRDQKITKQALESMQAVITRFPSSQYARDANLKLDLTRDHLAGKEMYVGRFYLRRGDTLAAINRFREVLLTYQTTTHVPEALFRLVEAYHTLGIDREAQQAAAVLGHNFPGSDWYRMAYDLVKGAGQSPQDVENAGFGIGSFWRQTWDKLF